MIINDHGGVALSSPSGSGDQVIEVFLPLISEKPESVAVTTLARGNPAVPDEAEARVGISFIPVSRLA